MSLFSPLDYQLKNTVCYYIPSPKNRNYFYKTPVSTFCPSSSFVLDTYSDFSAGSLNPAFYGQPLQHAGLIASANSTTNGRVMGMEMRQVLLLLLFNPSQELCEITNFYIHKLKQKTLIGVQLRLGGQHANYVERQMMSTGSIDTVILRVQYLLRKKKLGFKDVCIFLSSDSDYAINRLRKYFQKEQAFLVTTVTEFAVGHSAQAKSSNRGKERWADFTKRAIVDMMVLKESDFLIYTKKSSFGKFAYELQQAYANPMDVSLFLKQRGMNCSVFHEHTRIGEASAL